MGAVDEDQAPPGTRGGVADGERFAAAARLNDLFSDGEVSHERFAGALEAVFAAPAHDDLAAAMAGLPPIVRLTPAAHRLTSPLVLRAGGGGLRLGRGWQLGARTSVTTGVGRTRLDLAAATWDSLEIALCVETWGTVEVLVPHGVAVQLGGSCGGVRLEALTPPVPGGPVVRLTTRGPAGAVCVRHPGGRASRPNPRRPWRAVARPRPR
jgi:hypothetical protein